MARALAVKTAKAATGPGDNAGLIMRFVTRLPRLLVPHWPWLQRDGASQETVVACHGAVEIRQSPAGFSVQTCVKGEPDRARTTAVQRLTNYLAGHNRSGTRLCPVGPLVQREEAQGRWLVSAGLRGVEDAIVATLPRNGKVRICATQPEVHAVLRMSGRPTPEAIALADSVIRAVMGSTSWVPSGQPMIRLHRPPTILPFANRFEVALPMARRCFYAPIEHEACGYIIEHSAAEEHATHPSLPVHVVAC